MSIYNFNGLSVCSTLLLPFFCSSTEKPEPNIVFGYGYKVLPETQICLGGVRFLDTAGNSQFPHNVRCLLVS